MGIRRRGVVGLPRDGPVGLESTFAILEVEQEHDGSEERVVHRDASRESARRYNFRVSLRAEEQISPSHSGWVVGEIRVHARTRDPPS